ncbi:unnamed protein product [Meloidogyne enterolobii]|uniref:Uncharacterized protein n=1 Tax=Meloidogyne enterolobii TaxID=390850 RepID=A0ACB0Y3T3_MELEN
MIDSFHCLGILPLSSDVLNSSLIPSDEVEFFAGEFLSALATVIISKFTSFRLWLEYLGSVGGSLEGTFSKYFENIFPKI